MKNEFVCFLGKDHIKVNQTSLLSLDNALADDMIFYLMLSGRQDRSVLTNPDRITGHEAMRLLKEDRKEELEGTTYIMVIVPCGKEADSFIEPNQVKGIHFETDGFLPSEWTDLGEGDYGVVLTHQERRIEVDYADSFRFRMYHIVSQAPCGITNFSVALVNLAEGEDLIQTFQIYKRPAEPDILDFSPDRHSVALGEEVQFSWKTVGNDKGIIFPGDFSVGQGAGAFRHKVEKSAEYQICVQDGEKSVSRKAPIYLVPPDITEFVYDSSSGNVRWNCAYAQSVFYMGQEKQPKGEMACEQEQVQAVLMCRGYLTDIEKTLYLPREYKGNGILCKTILQFKNYSVVKLTWDMPCDVHIRITMGGTEDLISEQNSGSFEYPGVSLPKISVTLKKEGSPEWTCIVQKEGVYCV